MPHIHTLLGQHDHTVSAFIIDVSQAEPRLWLHSHKKYNKLMQFGGHVELNENPWQAICREIGEESGFAMDQLKILQPVGARPRDIDMVVWPQPMMSNTHALELGHFHDDLSYAFVTDEPPQNVVGEMESATLSLPTLKEIAAHDEGQIAANTQEMTRYLFENILGKWSPVACNEFAG
jgi:ADP-ribose pyrophosphatase YjhB (NUDIX family)